MTPNQGRNPDDQRGRQSPGTGQQPPGQRSPGQQPPGQPTQNPPQPQQGQPPQQPPQGRGGHQQPPAGSQQPRPTGTPAPQSQRPQSTGAPGQQAPIAGGQQPQPTGTSPQQPQPMGGGQQPQPIAGGQQPQPMAGRQQAQPMGGGQPSPGPAQQPGGAQPRGQPRLKPATVDDIAAEDVITAQPDTPVRTTVAQMAEHDVGAVVIVEDNKPVGVITDRKIALALEDTPDIADHMVGKMVDGEVITVDPSMTIFDAVGVMSDEGIRRLPVVDEDNQLQGILTLDDAIFLLGNEFEKVATTVEKQSPRL